ncbi:MAG: COX15/CtaA family protein [Rhizobiaceae bacterium]|nr:COX15/CtaA family protein [Rhizobiaceae bacterium]
MNTVADVSEFSGNASAVRRNRAQLRGWLFVVMLVLFALFVVGGATRLTGSGLSITEWKPIHGVIPPLNEQEWQEEFAKYKQIPEYQQINKGMEIAEFKSIFWWEWAHRMLARSVGILFALPLLVFWVTGRVERKLMPKLLGILALGGLQGAVGWWMVASGLVERTDVSQYRLATHLTIAAVIFAATAFVARGLAPDRGAPASRSTQRFAGLLVVVVLVQIYLGGLVAGLNAGLSYNTWPLMDGAIIPGDMFVIQPIWHNFFENPKLVQFDHRLGAYILFALGLWHMIAVRKREPGTAHARQALILFHIILLQAVIGIVTLLTQVHLHVALLHQAVAIAALGYAAAHWRATKGSYLLPAAA